MTEYVMFHQVTEGHEDEALLKDAEFPTLVGLWTEDHCEGIIEAEYAEPIVEIFAVEFCNRQFLGGSTTLFARSIPVTLVGGQGGDGI